MLLRVMVEKIYNLLHSLTAQQKPAQRLFNDNPKPLVIVVRFRFHNRNHLNNKSISNYMAEVRRLASLARACTMHSEIGPRIFTKGNGCHIQKVSDNQYPQSIKALFSAIG